MPQFQHANGAVLLTAVRVSRLYSLGCGSTTRWEVGATHADDAPFALSFSRFQVVMIHMKNVERDDLIKQLIRKMAPPLGRPPPLPVAARLSISDLVVFSPSSHTRLLRS